MNGSKHFESAEEWLIAAERPDRTPAEEQRLLAFALVHATLAQAAATAMNIRRNGAVEAVDEAAGWERVLG